MRPAILVLGAWGCAGDPAPRATEPDATLPVDDPVATTLAAAPLAWRAPPSLSANDHGALLTAWLDVHTSVPSTLTVAVTDPDGRREWTVDTPSAHHRHLLLGLRPDAAHTVEVSAHAGAHTLDHAPLPWHSEPLPAEAPVFVAAGDPARAEPGVTLLHVQDHVWMVASDGRVVWGIPASLFTHQVGLTPRGTLQWQVGQTHITELELSGEEARTLRAPAATAEDHELPIAHRAIHHDVFEMADGHLLTLGVEDRLYTGYPASESDPEPVQPGEVPVAGDLVLELDEAGVIVGEWALLDLLDPYRIGYSGLLGGYWDGSFAYDHIMDWSHGNSVWFDAVRDEIVVSLRHQDAVVAIDHGTGALAWIFAPEANWRPAHLPLVLRPELPADEPAYHQHAASVTDEGTLLLFDNGNNRASAYETRTEAEDNHSRCLEVAIDHASGTWTTVWSWGEDLVPARYSSSLGDCDALPLTGNRLITFGRLDTEGLPGAWLAEVDPAGELVWELAIDLADGVSAPNVYRAERLTGVIPGR